MATVEKLGGSWVIVRGQDMEASDGVGEVVSAAAREFWTGDGWARQYGFAKQFWTQEEAETYLAACDHELL